MKIDKIQPDHIGLKTEVSKKQQKEITLLATEPKIKGLRLYEYDKATGQVREVEFVNDETYVVGMEAKLKIFTRPNCLYVQASKPSIAAKKAKEIIDGKRKPKQNKGWKFPFKI